MGRCHIGGKGDFPLLARCQMDGHDVAAAQGSDDLALIADAIDGIVYNGSSVVQVQIALIVLVVGMARHGDKQVAKGLIGHTHVLACCHGHHLGIGQLLRFLVLALEDEPAHLGQILLGIGVHYIVRLPGPDGLLVQLDMLYGRSAIHHTPDDTISYGQRLRPGHGWLVVPEFVLVSR